MSNYYKWSRKLACKKECNRIGTLEHTEILQPNKYFLRVKTEEEKVEVDVKKIGELMQELGFNKDAPTSTKAAFLKALIKDAYQVEVQMPDKLEREQKVLQDNHSQHAFKKTEKKSPSLNSTEGKVEIKLEVAEQLSFDLEIA